MLTEFLIQDKTIASLGKTEHTSPVHVSGKTSTSALPREWKVSTQNFMSFHK